MKTSSNMPAPRIPSKYVDWARERDIVVIAGANQAIKYWRRIRSGLGTASRPFRGTQSLDAAIALAALSGRDHRTFYAWGYGPAVDPSETYFYQDTTGRSHRVRFLSREGMANAFNYSESAAHQAAGRLADDLALSGVIDPANVMFVGCSWGAALIDYAARRGRLAGPGVAIGGPRILPSWRLPWPTTCQLSCDGDHGALWVQRHPEDPIGATSVWPLISPARRRFHDYRALIPRAAGRAQFWGIDG